MKIKKWFILFAAIALVGALTTTAMAADWGLYGSVRMGTFYNMVDYGEQNAAGEDDSDSDLRWELQENSRIGARVADGNITGRFEYGNIAGNANIRILWAEYDFGGMKIGLGRHYTPVNAWVSSQVYADDAGLLDVGGIYGGRKDMIRATFLGGAFKLAFIEANVAGLNVDDGDFMDYDGTGGAADTDKLLPKIEARFDLSLGNDGLLALMGGFNSINVQDAGGNESGSIKSYVAGIMGAHNFGAMYINWDAFYAVNAGNYGLGSGWVIGSAQAYAYIDPNSFDTADASSIGALVAFGMVFNDTISMEVGTGYRVDDNEDMGFDDPDTTMACYGLLPIVLGKGFFVAPEIGAYFGGEDGNGNDSDTITYVGAKWQINF